MRFPCQSRSWLILALVSLVFFSGCQTTKMATSEISRANNEADLALKSKPIIPDDVRYHKTPWYFGHSDRIRLEDRRMASRIEKVLPDFMLQRVTWTDKRSVTIYDIARWLSERTGVPVEVHTPRILHSAGTTGTASATGIQAGATGPGGVPFPPGGIGQPGQIQPAGVGFPSQKWNRKLQMHWVGKPLSGFLDMVASGMGLFWDWNGHSIAFYRSATKTFKIVAPPVSANVNDTISDVGATGIMGLIQAMSGLNSASGMNSLGGGGFGQGGIGPFGMTSGLNGLNGMNGGTGGLNSMSSQLGSGGQQSGMPGQNVSVSSTSAVWTELQNGIAGIIGNEGSFTPLPSAGKIAVTTTPAIMRQVEKFIRSINNTFSHQVWIEVRVLEVEMDRQDQNELNWAAVIHGAFGPGALGGGLAGTGLGQIFSSGATSPVSAMTFTFPNSNTQAVVNSLSTRYHTSTVTTVTVRTLNDQAAPIQNVNTQSYLAEVLAGVAGIGQSTFSQSIPSQVTVGFTSNILPHLLGDNDHMILEMSADLSALISITNSPGAGGGATIQLPNVSSRSFMQRIRIKSGQTAIISGYEAVNAVMQQNGSFGNPNDFMFGGGNNAQRNRTKIVILVTPIVEKEAA